MNVIDLLFCYFLYSFIGWFGESCYCSIRPRKWVNRGFLRGPVCPIYGAGAMVLILIILPLRDLHTPSLFINEAIVFAVGMVVCDAVEFATSYIMEKIFNARWWDYSGMRFNIQGRICLTHTFYWGTAACLFAFVLHPFIDTFLIQEINAASRAIIVYICLTVFVLDLIDTVLNALVIRKYSTQLKQLSDDVADFAMLAYSVVGAKISTVTEERRTELLHQLGELRGRYDRYNADAHERRNRSKERLMRAFPFIKEGLGRQQGVLSDLFDDLKEKITDRAKTGSQEEDKK